MTILAISKNAARRAGYTPPSALVGSTDALALQILGIANDLIKKARNKYPWPQFQKIYTFTLSDGVASYALPNDIHYQLSDTQWNRDDFWALWGPMTPQEWAYLKSGAPTVSIPKRYRIYGYETETFHIDPTPDSGDDGNTIALDFVTRNCVRPPLWAASTDYSVDDYVFTDGRYYKCTVAGTSSSTAPTHTSGTDTDGTVTWSYYDEPYEDFLTDNDVSLIDENVLEQGIFERLGERRGIDFVSRYPAELEAAFGRTKPGRSITLLRKRASSQFYGSVPRTGFSVTS